ncbi:MAG: DUF5667 domain-containing protein [Actinomycetota bacterium]|nr:DUF5667 domain-containing protein [Actinomycetota bacterium]MDQ2956076.1 DUF5667 domain-containing protein [Actinomycetota bacterium]
MGAGRFAARSGDEHGRSAVEADLIARLRELPVGPVPDSRFKAELRSQLVAIAPRIIAESDAEVPAATAARSPNRTGFLRTVRRPLIAVAGSATVLVLLLGLAVWMSNGALPGQSLYGVKRASENFQLSIAGSDTDKAKAYLQQATSRAQETDKLVGAAGTPSSRVSSLIASTLSNADSDTRNGMQLLGGAAVSQMSAAPLAGLGVWVQQQRTRFTDLQGRLPAGAAHTHVESSIALLQRVATRAAALQSRIGCSCLSRAHSDDLGPLPCTSCGAVKTPGVPVIPGLPTQPGSALPSQSGSSPSDGASSGGGGSAGSPAPQPSLSVPNLGGGGTPSATVPGGRALSDVPVSAGPSGISASLPGGGRLSVGPSGVLVTLPPLPLP